MIQEVRPGEKISAKTQNEIIQAANGLMQPASKFVNTPNGSLYPSPTPQFNNMLGRCVETLFQLKFELKQHLSKRIADEDAQKLSAEYALSSVWYGYSMNLGNDFQQLKDQVKLMQPDNDDIFIIGSNGINGNGSSENGDRLSVHLTGSQMLVDGSDKEGFFDLGIYWKSPFEGCSEIEVEQLTLSSDNPQYGPTKNAFVIRGKNYPSQSILEDWYEEKYGDTWTVTDSSTTTVGYVYDQRLVQLRTGLLFPQTAKEWVDSQLSGVRLSSVQERVYDGTSYHQMFNFDQNSLSDFALSDQNDCDIVIRDYKRDRVPDGACVNYVKVHDFLSATRYDVDTDATQGAQRSIEVTPHGGDIKRDYLQLYDFDNSIQNEFLDCHITYGEVSYVVRPGQSTWYPDSQIQFVCRDYTEHGQDGQIVYDGIKVYAPKPSAYDIDDLSSVVSAIVIEIDPGHECSCNLSALSAKVDDLSSEFSDKVVELSSELSDRWICGGDYMDNCFGESIGDTSRRPQINLDIGQLVDSNINSPTVDWHNGLLIWNYNEVRLDWSDCRAYDKSQEPAIDWDSRHLKDTGGIPAVDWSNRFLYDSASTAAVDWENRELLHNWKVDGDLSLGNGQQLKIGSTTLNENQLQRLLALI